VTGPRQLPPPTPRFAGTPPFPEAARSALANDQQRENLRRATTTIRTKRARAVAEIDDWEELRLAGAAIKDEALARLPELLEDLERNVTAAGGIVHWARDAAEANALVVGLVRDAGADEVVKVKSMATQEIELNEALAAAGIAAWETDLAELIVQLGRDLPSHFLVPAIHRNRTEIRDIFVREMGLAGRPAPEGLTDDPPDLAEAARLHLREKFLRARVAISGANFAVAETGTVMVVESEGNGRMCLTLPDTLITVMGVEKLIPRWSDLEVFLQLLPRSSTAERMNPYTSMWTGVTPGDGPQAFHLVLLDNGRSATLSDPVGRQALRCIKCSACLNVCPVYERTGGRAYGSPYAGPIGAILTPQLRGIATDKVDDQTASLPYASSLCGACFEVCPVRIDIPEVLVHLRAKVVEQHGWRSTLSQEGLLVSGLSGAFGGSGRLAAAERVAAVAARPLARRGRIADCDCPAWPVPGSGRATSRRRRRSRSGGGGRSGGVERGAAGDPRRTAGVTGRPPAGPRRAAAVSAGRTRWHGRRGSLR
jgi:L-lactate dehydrogenase complex protein LldF